MSAEPRDSSDEKEAEETPRNSHDSSRGDGRQPESVSVRAAKPAAANGRSPNPGSVSLHRTLSAQSRPASVVKIPRSQSTGLLGRFALIYEVEQPLHYPRAIKWTITFFISVCAMVAPMGSSIIFPALPQIIEAFHTDAFTANLSVAFYMLAMSIFPLWWSAFSETAGRRTVYLTSFVVYTVFNILSAVASSIGMFIAMRLLSGGASASVQAIGAGTIADIWAVKERGRAMGIFYLGPLCGPLLSPVIGGALTVSFGWRSVQWFQVIFGGAMLLCILLFLPETHRTRPLAAEAERRALERTASSTAVSKMGEKPPMTRQASRQSVVKHTHKSLYIANQIFLEPLKVTLYLRFPPVLCVVWYAAVSFGCLYFLNVSVEKTFSAPPYNFSAIIVGCLYLSNSVGYLITSILGGRWVDYIMAREARKAGRIDERGKLIYLPEDRLRENAWLGAVVMPASLIWYGWAAEQQVFWLVPIIANFFFGAGSMLIFAAATTMLTEFMPKKASSGVALNNFFRNIFSFGGILLAEPLIKAMGNGWLFTMLAAISLLSSVVIWLMKRNGEKWRAQMDREMD